MSTRDTQSRRVFMASVLMTGSLAGSVILAIAVSAQRTKWALVSAALLGLIIALWYVARRLVRERLAVGLLFLVSVVNLTVVIPELALRLVDFRYESGIQFGYPSPTAFAYLVPDEALFWKLPAWDSSVNSLGFPGNEITTPKPPDTYRIVFLGDSCTQQGFPSMVEVLLNDQLGDESPRVECLTLAVSGYSSHQGRVIAEQYALRCEPDLAVVYFGWNDHWQAYGAVDSAKVVQVSETVPSRAVLWLYRKSRVLQAGRRLKDALVNPSAGTPLREVRVPPDEYRQNLLRIDDVFRQQGVPVAFITAPTSHYQLGVPEYLVQENFLPDKASGIRLHQAYNGIVRNVAASRNAPLLDLEAAFATLQDPEKVFTQDGIHFHAAGLALVARRVTDLIVSGVLPRQSGLVPKPPVSTGAAPEKSMNHG